MIMQTQNDFTAQGQGLTFAPVLLLKLLGGTQE